MRAEVFAPGQSLNPEAGSALFRRHWGWLLAFAVVQVVAGSLAISISTLGALVAVAVFGCLLIVGWPGTALWALGLMLGVNLVFNGAPRAALALACRKRQKETARGDSTSGHAAATA
jgi:uncharacterized membrane protein HdeD (DUF308 family)